MKKNKLLIGILILLLLVFIMNFIFPVIYLRYNFQKNMNNKLTRIPYITVEISSNEVITAEKISYKNIKSIDVPNNIYINEKDFIGKCISDNSTILAGEYVVKEKIKECEN